MRGVTADKLSVEFVHSFQLTRLMRGVTEEYGSARWGTEISTHTPHARRD